MQHKNFFNARYFSPNTCKIFTKFANSSGNVTIRMYESQGFVEFDIPGFIAFIPRSILNDHLRFGKAIKPKKLILQLSLSENDIFELIKALGGTLKKRKNPPTQPTLGDLLK